MFHISQVTTAGAQQWQRQGVLLFEAVVSRRGSMPSLKREVGIRLWRRVPVIAFWSGKMRLERGAVKTLHCCLT